MYVAHNFQINLRSNETWETIFGHSADIDERDLVLDCPKLIAKCALPIQFEALGRSFIHLKSLEKF